jgi:hypothetical protein
MDDLEDIDTRPALFVGLTPENLARQVASYPRTEATPPSVADLLAEARRTFAGAAACYDNFASAAFKSLQAAELALRTLLGSLKRPGFSGDSSAWISEREEGVMPNDKKQHPAQRRYPPRSPGPSPPRG